MLSLNLKTITLSAMALFVVSGAAQALDTGYRALDAENTLVIDTSKGRVIVEMYPQMAPNHVTRIKTLVRQHFYDGHKFHRVIEGFMAQTGDPTGTGTGGSTLPDLAGEFTLRRGLDLPVVVVSRPHGLVQGFVGAMPVQGQNEELMAITVDNKANMWPIYCQGVMAMARENDPNTGNSQFFIMRAVNPVLEKRYTAFGTVVSGLEFVKKLKLGEPPKDPDTMTKVQVLADMPQASRPNLQIMDTGSELFKTELAKKRKALGGEVSPCEINLNAKPIP